MKMFNSPWRKFLKLIIYFKTKNKQTIIFLVALVTIILVAFFAGNYSSMLKTQVLSDEQIKQAFIAALEKRSFSAAFGLITLDPEELQKTVLDQIKNPPASYKANTELNSIATDYALGYKTGDIEFAKQVVEAGMQIGIEKGYSLDFATARKMIRAAIGKDYSSQQKWAQDLISRAATTSAGKSLTGFSESNMKELRDLLQEASQSSKNEISTWAKNFINSIRQNLPQLVPPTPTPTPTFDYGDSGSDSGGGGGGGY